MGDWKRWAPPLIAEALLAFGLLGLDWFVVEQARGIELHVRPFRGEICIRALDCKDIAAGSGTYRVIASVLFWMGLLSAAALIGLAITRRIGIDTGPIETLTGWACGGVTMLTVLSLIAFGTTFAQLRWG